MLPKGILLSTRPSLSAWIGIFMHRYKTQGHTQSWEAESKLRGSQNPSTYASIYMGFVVVGWRYQEETKVPPFDTIAHFMNIYVRFGARVGKDCAPAISSRIFRYYHGRISLWEAGRSRNVKSEKQQKIWIRIATVKEKLKVLHHHRVAGFCYLATEDLILGRTTPPC